MRHLDLETQRAQAASSSRATSALLMSFWAAIRLSMRAAIGGTLPRAGRRGSAVDSVVELPAAIAESSVVARAAAGRRSRDQSHAMIMQSDRFVEQECRRPVERPSLRVGRRRSGMRSTRAVVRRHASSSSQSSFDRAHARATTEQRGSTVPSPTMSLAGSISSRLRPLRAATSATNCRRPSWGTREAARSTMFSAARPAGFPAIGVLVRMRGEGLPTACPCAQLAAATVGDDQEIQLKEMAAPYDDRACRHKQINHDPRWSTIRPGSPRIAELLTAQVQMRTSSVRSHSVVVTAIELLIKRSPRTGSPGWVARYNRRSNSLLDESDFLVVDPTHAPPRVSMTRAAELQRAVFLNAVDARPHAAAARESRDEHARARRRLDHEVVRPELGHSTWSMSLLRGRRDLGSATDASRSHFLAHGEAALARKPKVEDHRDQACRSAVHGRVRDHRDTPPATSNPLLSR